MFSNIYISKIQRKKNVISEVSACVTERFNGFTIVRIEFDKKIRRNFTPVDLQACEKRE